MDETEIAIIRKRFPHAFPVHEKLTQEFIERLRDTNSADAMARFDDVFEWAIKNLPARTTSGLIEQQRLFMK